MNALASLAAFLPLERVRPRPTDDAELLEFAGRSRDGLYRLIASGEIACERSPAQPRKDGRRGATRIFVTLEAVAEWRAARSAGAPVTDAVVAEVHEATR